MNDYFTNYIDGALYSYCSAEQYGDLAATYVNLRYLKTDSLPANIPDNIEGDQDSDKWVRLKHYEGQIIYLWEYGKRNCYIHGQGRAVFQKGLKLNGTFNMNAVDGLGVAFIPGNYKYQVEPDSIDFEETDYNEWLSNSRLEYTLKIGHFN